MYFAEDSLNLKVGDQIIWQGDEIKEEDGPAIVSPGMKRQVISLHDGFHMDLARIDHRFGNEGDFGRPERFSESFAIDPVQVE